KKYDEELTEYEKNLEKIYNLCSKCKKNCEKILKKQDSILKENLDRYYRNKDVNKNSNDKIVLKSGFAPGNYPVKEICLERMRNIALYIVVLFTLSVLTFLLIEYGVINNKWVVKIIPYITTLLLCYFILTAFIYIKHIFNGFLICVVIVVSTIFVFIYKFDLSLLKKLSKIMYKFIAINARTHFLIIIGLSTLVVFLLLFKRYNRQKYCKLYTTVNVSLNETNESNISSVKSPSFLQDSDLSSTVF
ncbi:hypothetical protein A3Q56_07278, partial [Intoshia linei]